MAKILTWLIWLWLKSLRVQHINPAFQGKLFALWHRDLPACMMAFAGQNITVQISNSQDGQIATEIAQRLGYQVVRGSSSHRQASIRALLKALQNQNSIGIALDGPSGPAGLAKAGAQWLSIQSSVPITGITVNYSWTITLPTWDRMQIPLPFSRIHITTHDFA